MLLATAVSALPLSPPYVPLNSTAGLELLLAANTARVAYEQASVHLVTQEDTASCSHASSVVVLNALAPYGVGAPTSPEYAQAGAYWTQTNYGSLRDLRSPMQLCVVSNCTKPCTLAQSARALNCVPGVTATAHHADEIDGPADLQALIRATVSAPGKQMLVNFDGFAGRMNITHGGHFSPIAALAGSMALVLDVSRYKYPPWWAPVGTLWAGINTADPSAGMKRGVITVGAKGVVDER